MSRYEGQDRYQFQSRPVKVCRWLRHMPLAYALAVYHVARWGLHGFQVMPGTEYDWSPSRREMFTHIFQMCVSRAQYDMGAWCSMEEVLEDYRAKAQQEN